MCKPWVTAPLCREHSRRAPVYQRQGASYALPSAPGTDANLKKNYTQIAG